MLLGNLLILLIMSILYLLLNTARYHTRTPSRIMTGMPIINTHFRGDFRLVAIGGIEPFGVVLPNVIDGVGVLVSPGIVAIGEPIG